MSALIPIKEGQMNFVTPPSFVQLALELESPSKVSSIVDYLSDSLAALHLRMRSPSEFEFDRKHLIVHDLPKNAAKSLTDAAEYSGLHFTPNQDEAFASIAIHDNIVVLNASHRFCDGGFFKFLLSNFPNPPKLWKSDEDWLKSLKDTSRLVPRFTSDIFGARANDAPPMKAIPFDPKVTRFVPKMIPSQNSQYRQIKEIMMLSNEFATYNKAKNAPSSLTESMWMANYFALSALNYDKHGKEFFDNFKVHTVVDLRPYLSYKPDFLSCYHCAHIAPGVSQIKSNDKIADVGKKIRNDLQRLLKEGYQYSTLKAETSGPLYYGINGSLSQIGRLELKRPIIDAHISIRLDASKQQSPEKCIGTLGMFSWSVSSPEPSKNHFVTQIGYSGNELPEEDVNKSTKRIEYFLKNISHQQTIKEVFDIIKKVE